ncbi:MAG: hypothetical protein HZB23_10735 [Deltaproteobacteria bacterium]|nr:hypothetical protein [Deltaproteobacteria bacterium]
MAAITSANVAVSPQSGCVDISPRSHKTMGIFDVSFGDGALTYPAGGVPLPAIGNFGFKKIIQFGLVQQPVTNGFLYKYDPSSHKVKIYTQGVVTGATAAAANTDGAKVLDSGGSEVFPRLPGTAASTTYDLGGMIELPATVAPAAVTVSLLLIGE